MAGQCVLLQIYATTKMAECQKKKPEPHAAGGGVALESLPLSCLPNPLSCHLFFNNFPSNPGRPLLLLC